jgi:dTDP-4-amino-4,6-dideoxygalactose transaminase
MKAVKEPVKMSVPLLDLKGQFNSIRAEVMPLIDQVCSSQMFILGEHVRGLEAEIASYCKAAHGIGVSSGTDALLVALMALDIGAGDEVITSPYTFFATAGTIARVGARPVFCDIDARTFNLSIAKVQEFIERECRKEGGVLINKATGGKVRALMPVHLYGQSVDMQPLMRIAREHGLKVIEDAAQAIGTEYLNGARIGSIGDIGCFSFFPSKNLGAFGDGGLCTANDAELAERLMVLRVHGSKPKYYHSFIGGNFRLDELQAAVLRVKLKHLDAWTASRQANAAFYDAEFGAAKLEGKLITPYAVPGCRHIYNQYVVRAADRDGLRAHLASCGIGTEIYYPVSLHQQKCFEYLGYKTGDFPESERAAAETVALPIYPELTNDQLAHVVTSIAEFYT